MKDAVRVYVYDLPPQLNTWMTYHSDTPFQGSTTHPSIGRTFDSRMIEVFLHERFLTSAHRTSEPAHADFFYVPIW
jgi:hypothetical protein